MGNGFINSLAITLPATFIPILMAAFAAYAFTFMGFRGRDILFLVIVSLLVVPNYVAFVPMLKIYGDRDERHVPGGVAVPTSGSACHWRSTSCATTWPPCPRPSSSRPRSTAPATTRRSSLVLPMSVPALASFAIFQFLWVWNDLLVALVFIGPGDRAADRGTSGLSVEQGQGWELSTTGRWLPRR